MSYFMYREKFNVSNQYIIDVTSWSEPCCYIDCWLRWKVAYVELNKFIWIPVVPAIAMSLFKEERMSLVEPDASGG